MKSIPLLAALLLLAAPLPADVSSCACDPANPASMKARECSLCAEAEKQPASVDFFVLKDINPRKPGRWLILPRAHSAGGHHLHDMPPARRAQLWRFAINAAREKFGDDWGLAYNGWKVRTQCHLHIHAGRFIRAAENSKVTTVRRVEDFPAPGDAGILVHPVPGGFHVHSAEQILETALVR